MTALEKAPNPHTQRAGPLWAFKIIVALIFIGSGSAKLLGQPYIVEQFSKIGLGQWFRYVTGVIELSSAALYLWPRTSFSRRQADLAPSGFVPF